MTAARFLEAWKARPFRPFVLRLADGRSVPVAHPELVGTDASRGGRTAVVFSGDDRMNIVDLLLVTDLDFSIGVESA